MGNEKEVNNALDNIFAEEVLESIEAFSSIAYNENIPQEIRNESLNRLAKRRMAENLNEEYVYLNKILLDVLRKELAEFLEDETIPKVFRDDVLYRTKDNDFHADYLQQKINFLKRVKEKKGSL